MIEAIFFGAFVLFVAAITHRYWKRPREAKLVVDKVIDDLQRRPMDFVAGRHTLTDKTTGIEYWIANTQLDAGVYSPYELDFGWYGLRFHRAVSKWKAWRTLNEVREVEDR